MAPIDISSGDTRIDAYLNDGYEQVLGMSSRFAAAICAHIVKHQTASGIHGDIAELGAFEGRFFIATALALAPGERALGLDVFTWPSEKVEDHFVANCLAHGLKREDFISWKADTRAISPDDFRSRMKSESIRFFHIDSDHEYDCLTNDLELAHPLMHPKGVMALDDMLHPGYPTLVTAVFDYLRRHPEMRVCAIIDREDIVAAAKFLLCRAEMADMYATDLLKTYPKFEYLMGANVFGHDLPVLTPFPRLAKVD